MSDMYHPEQIEQDANQKRMMLDTASDVQTILQLLVQKNIVTREEVSEMRNKVRNSPKYKDAYNYIYGLHAASDLYKNDPQAYLKALFNAKLNGKD